MKTLIPVALVAAALFAGCGKDDHEGHDHDHDGPETTEELTFDGLSGADVELAKAQKVCPVSGELLGSMGTPLKMEAEGKTVFLCCDGCTKKFNADPGKYIEKLGLK